MLFRIGLAITVFYSIISQYYECVSGPLNAACMPIANVLLGADSADALLTHTQHWAVKRCAPAWYGHKI